MRRLSEYYQNCYQQMMFNQNKWMIFVYVCFFINLNLKSLFYLLNII